MGRRPSERPEDANCSATDLRTHREAIYEQLFGKITVVSHELLLKDPHIDVYTFAPGFADRPCYTLVTGGMSDFAMKDASGVDLRSELILYVDEPKPLYVNLLRYLAHIPHDQKTWFWHGSTMTNGDPPESLFEASALDTILFLYTVVSPDSKLWEHLVIEGRPAGFLWVVPITGPEREFVREHGVDELMEIFEEREHPVVLDERRKSYV